MMYYFSPNGNGHADEPHKKPDPKNSQPPKAPPGASGPAGASDSSAAEGEPLPENFGLEDLPWLLHHLARKLVPEQLIRFAIAYEKIAEKFVHDPRVRVAAAHALAALDRLNHLHRALAYRHERKPTSNLQLFRSQLRAIARRLDARNVD